ncbi:hypothetical protein ACXR8F_04405 [Terrabacter sp. AAH1]
MTISSNSIGQGSGTPDDLRRALREAERERSSSAGRNAVIRDEYSRASLNMWPALIPRESIDPGALVKAVQTEFGAQLNTSELFKGVPPDVRSSIDLSSLIKHTLSDDDSVLYFQGGHLSIPDTSRITPISSLAVSEQTISASVNGSSDESEYLCKRLAVLVSASAGVARVWRDFEPHVELIAYMTSTVVDLGFPLDKLFRPGFTSFLAGLKQPAGLAEKMGGVTRSSASGSSEYATAIGARRLEIDVRVTEKTSGRQSTAKIELLTHTVSDLGGGRVKVLTELSSADHYTFIRDLITAIESETA